MTVRLPNQLTCRSYPGQVHTFKISVAIVLRCVPWPVRRPDQREISIKKTLQPWEMGMNITYTGFIADVSRVIAVIKISQPIVPAQNFPAT